MMNRIFLGTLYFASLGILLAFALSGCAAGLAGVGAAVIEPLVEGTVKGIVEGLKQPQKESRVVCEPYTPNDPNYCFHWRKDRRGAVWHYEA